MKILYTDRSEQLLEPMKLFLESEECFSVETAAGYDRALKKATSCDFDAVVSPYDLGDGTGVSLAISLKAAGKGCHFVLFTNVARAQVENETIGLGCRVVPKDDYSIKAIGRLLEFLKTLKPRGG